MVCWYSTRPCTALKRRGPQPGEPLVPLSQTPIALRVNPLTRLFKREFDMRVQYGDAFGNHSAQDSAVPSRTKDSLEHRKRTKIRGLP